jgi:hypothetical protein
MLRGAEIPAPQQRLDAIQPGRVRIHSGIRTGRST